MLSDGCKKCGQKWDAEIHDRGHEYEGKRCTIEQSWYYGTMYYWKDTDTGKESSRCWNTEEECLADIHKNGYMIQYRNRGKEKNA